jgi:hypothetical protein
VEGLRGIIDLMIIVVFCHAEPLREEAALTLERLAALHTDPLPDKVALAVPSEVCVIFHTREATAREARHEARLGGASTSFTQGIRTGRSVIVGELTAAKRRLVGGHF